MNKYVIGIIFIIAGLGYGSLAFDRVYEFTMGYLLKNGWVKPPAAEKLSKDLFGRRLTILMYSLILIVIGIYILWKLQS